MDDVLDALVEWIRETAGRARGLLVPVSGGTDGALCFWLCAHACPGKTTGLFVRGEQDLRERAWFEAVGPVETHPLPAGARHPEVARWALCLERSLEQDWWLIGTRNRTEELLGTYSLASRLATVLPLAGLWKSDVLRLCSRIGVPEPIIDSSREADMSCGRTHEIARIRLEEIDRFVRICAGLLPADAPLSLPPSQVALLQRIYDDNRFKQALPARGPQHG